MATTLHRFRQSERCPVRLVYSIETGEGKDVRAQIAASGQILERVLGKYGIYGLKDREGVNHVRLVDENLSPMFGRMEIVFEHPKMTREVAEEVVAVFRASGDEHAHVEDK